LPYSLGTYSETFTTVLAAESITCSTANAGLTGSVWLARSESAIAFFKFFPYPDFMNSSKIDKSWARICSGDRLIDLS